MNVQAYAAQRVPPHSIGAFANPIEAGRSPGGAGTLEAAPDKPCSPIAPFSAGALPIGISRYTSIDKLVNAGRLLENYRIEPRCPSRKRRTSVCLLLTENASYAFTSFPGRVLNWPYAGVIAGIGEVAEKS